MSDLPKSTLGRTGLEVTRLGFGAMELRGADSRMGARARSVDRNTADAVLNAVLDAGINYIDTSPDYGSSEELIGECISSRRDEFFLASKCGCPVASVVSPTSSPSGGREHVFTRANVRAGVEQSLRRMRTDHLDLVQFHASPARQVLEDEESVAELLDLKGEGKVRFLGMSGTLPNLTDHIAMGVFDAFQIPYSAVERQHDAAIAEASAAGAGIIIRGGVARGLPEVPEEGLGELPERFRTAYVQRRQSWESAGLDELLDGMSSMEFMLRFTLSHPDLDTTIVGTMNPDHLAANVVAAAKGPLTPEIYEEAKRRLPS